MDARLRRRRAPTPVAGLIASASCLACLAVAAGPASGFSIDFDYSGHVKHEQASSVGFKAGRSGSGHKRVTEFTVTHVPITCSDSDATTSTDGYQFAQPMRVKHRQFAGSGDWTVILLDPSGSVSGKLRPDGTAVGTFRLRGELAGTGTHCHTGPLDWTAIKVA